jgi:hypothetical protein
MAEAEIQDVITARRIEIVDDLGRVRVEVGIEDECAHEEKFYGVTLRDSMGDELTAWRAAGDGCVAGEIGGARRTAHCDCTWWRDDEQNSMRRFHDFMLGLDSPQPLRALANAVNSYADDTFNNRDTFASFVAQHNWKDPVGAADAAQVLDYIFEKADRSERVSA